MIIALNTLNGPPKGFDTGSASQKSHLAISATPDLRPLVPELRVFASVLRIFFGPPTSKTKNWGQPEKAERPIRNESSIKVTQNTRKPGMTALQDHHRKPALRRCQNRSQKDTLALLNFPMPVETTGKHKREPPFPHKT